MARFAQTDYSAKQRISRKDAESAGLTQYFTGDPCSNGHIAPRNVKFMNCLVCHREDALARQRAKRAYSPEEFRANTRQRRVDNPVRTMFLQSKSRAKKNGIPFSITQDDIRIPDDCPCCSRRMQDRQGGYKNGPTDSSPSLDRFVAHLGYTPGNVAVICWRCNRLKMNASVKELREILAWMESVQNTRPVVRLAAVNQENGCE